MKHSLKKEKKETIMPAFRNKAQFYGLWSQGLVWNKPHTWETLEEAMASGFNRTVAIRYKGKSGGGPFVPDLTLADLPRELQRVCTNGFKPEDFNFSEQMSPDTVRYLINGELTRNHFGLDLFFSEENKLMRPALLSSGKRVKGLVAKLVLEQLLWPVDMEALLETVDAYPDHTVEFSAFDREVGIIRGRRMIIWEVRLY